MRSIILSMSTSYRSSREEVFCKKGFLKILQNSQEKNCSRVFILKKFQASACKFIAKRRL